MVAVAGGRLRTITVAADRLAGRIQSAADLPAPSRSRIIAGRFGSHNQQSGSRFSGLDSSTQTDQSHPRPDPSCSLSGGDANSERDSPAE